jgi:hypothetical protein
MPKALDWKRYRISMLEVEAVPQSCENIFVPGKSPVKVQPEIDLNISGLEASSL